MANKWKYLVVADDMSVQGTDSLDEAKELAASQVVIQINSDGTATQLDEDGDTMDIPGV